MNKDFAKAALKIDSHILSLEEAVLLEHPFVIGLTLLGSIALGSLAGIQVMAALESDPGSPNQEKVHQEYKLALENLKEQKTSNADLFRSDAQFFASRIHSDSRLSEEDAAQLIDHFKKQITTFETLGFDEAPDAYDLRECQARHTHPKDINICTNQHNHFDHSDAVRGILFGSGIASLLFPLLPLLWLQKFHYLKRMEFQKIASGEQVKKKLKYPH